MRINQHIPAITYEKRGGCQKSMAVPDGSISIFCEAKTIGGG